MGSFEILFNFVKPFLFDLHARNPKSTDQKPAIF
jgi:hypothetical protein